MTQPILAETDVNTGERFYKNGEGKRNYGVTSVLGVLSKPYLLSWAGKVVAEVAVEIMVEPERYLYPYYDDEEDDYDWELLADDLKKAHEWERDGAGSLGDEVHDAVEQVMSISKGKPDIAKALIDEMELSAEARKRLGNFVVFLEDNDVRPIDLECSIYNDTYGYAGSTDAVLMLNGKPTFADWKTSKQLDKTMALQLSAYSRGEYKAVMGDDGHIEKYPMPIEYTHDTQAVIIHITPTEVKVVPVDIGDDVFNCFLKVLSIKREWYDGCSKEAVGKPMYTTKKKKVKEEAA